VCSSDLALYYLTPRAYRSLTLAIASYVFYGWWRPDFVILMLISTVVDYCCGKAIHAGRSEGRRCKRWVVLSLVVNLGLLAYFKYANFGIDTLNQLLASLHVAPIEWVKVVLPIGISFYTFQTISYTIDVYRGSSEPVKNFRDFMCYVAMFPQLVAGPIVRYNTIAEQLHSRTHTFSKFYLGVIAFQCGMAKKVLIADVLGPVADEAFASGSIGTLDAWLGMLAYTFQIYFDFSGYSDMAIGLGLMMGFRLPINFNQPYRSVSITDFWRRWHISLSAFLRDYLYIPLGGNKKGPLRMYVNLSLTMLLGGLWHGAAWTFIIWGAYQGFWLVVERLCGKSSLYGWAPRPAQIVVTFVLAMFGWVFFRATDLSAAIEYFGALFGSPQPAGAFDAALAVRPLHWIVGAIAAAVVWLAPTTQQIVHEAKPRYVLPLQVLFVLALVHLHYEDHVPFLYFQF
jgi:alginate O-acetyltransferase complex protein AlgI